MLKYQGSIAQFQIQIKQLTRSVEQKQTDFMSAEVFKEEISDIGVNSEHQQSSIIVDEDHLATFFCQNQVVLNFADQPKDQFSESERQSSSSESEMFDEYDVPTQENSPNQPTRPPEFGYSHPASVTDQRNSPQTASDSNNPGTHSSDQQTIPFDQINISFHQQNDDFSTSQSKLRGSSQNCVEESIDHMLGGNEEIEELTPQEVTRRANIISEFTQHLQEYEEGLDYDTAFQQFHGEDSNFSSSKNSKNLPEFKGNDTLEEEEISLRSHYNHILAHELQKIDSETQIFSEKTPSKKDVGQALGLPDRLNQSDFYPVYTSRNRKTAQKATKHGLIKARKRVIKPMCMKQDNDQFKLKNHVPVESNKKLRMHQKKLSEKKYIERMQIGRAHV